MSKPLVIVIENPEADPSVWAFGDVEVIELSSYPASHWCDPTEREDYRSEGWGDDMRALADRMAGLGVDGVGAATELRQIAACFENRCNNEKEPA